MENVLLSNIKKIIFTPILPWKERMLNYLDIIILYYISKNIIREKDETSISNVIEKKSLNDDNPFIKLNNIKTLNKLSSKESLINNNMGGIKTAINIIKLILKNFFPSKLSIINDLINNIIQKNYEYKNNKFIFDYNISENNIILLEKEIENLEISKNNNQVLKLIKTHMIIIINFIKYMKDSLFEIIILNPNFLSNKNDALNFFSYFKQIEKLLENCFIDGDILKIKITTKEGYYYNSDNISSNRKLPYYYDKSFKFDRIFIHLIKERDLIVIILNNEIRIYDIKGKNLFCKTKFQSDYYYDKFFKLNYDFFLIIRDKKPTYYIKINYDSTKKPKNITILEDNFFKYLDENISNLEVIERNNIICVGKNYLFLVGKKINNELFLKEKIMKFGNQNLSSMDNIIDKYNNQIIFYSNELLCYKLNDVNLKKRIILPMEYNNYIRLFKIYDKYNYIVCTANSIYLISSKSLEILTKYKLKKQYERFIIISNLNKIFLFLYNSLTICQLDKTRLIYLQTINFNKFFDVIEINNKKEFILATKMPFSIRYYNKKFDILKFYQINNNTNLENILKKSDIEDDKKIYDDDDYDYY